MLCISQMHKLDSFAILFPLCVSFSGIFLCFLGNQTLKVKILKNKNKTKNKNKKINKEENLGELGVDLGG